MTNHQCNSISVAGLGHLGQHLVVTSVVWHWRPHSILPLALCCLFFGGRAVIRKHGLLCKT
ncbi:hypothetical protein EDD36DRAFT_439845 [Exophiala viscosa]|uniref:Uncharacterized protein n=1 Tax=Exophiala viscosa TaxID=2486360 RepID=A0AAN6DUN8_9EURO|nr:hypothetical protein EDD36DRAFT_439845 [Exophiala viscosa]